MNANSVQSLISILVAVACGFGGTSCGPDLPPSLPSTAAHDRTASRVELVDLLISDPARAEKVRSLYIEMEGLMLGAKRTNAGEIVKLGAENPTQSDAETRAIVAKVRDAELAAFRRYVKLQLEVRRSTTPEEFARLDALK